MTKKVKNHQVRINLKSDAKTAQQKGRRISIHLREAVDREINVLLIEDHIKNFREIK